MQTIIRLAVLAICLLAALPFSAQNTFVPDELIVSASALNLRDKPDKSGKVLEKLPRGAALTFVETVNNGEYVEVDSLSGIWLKVQSKNKTGFVFSPFVAGAYNLYLEGDLSMDALPALNWYGVYVRDSFADELRRIDVRLESEYHEFFMAEVNALRTDQEDPAKFILATAAPMKTGFVGNLGMYDPDVYYQNASLPPGAMLAIYPGQEPEDTTASTSYLLAATGCAEFGDQDFVQMRDYQLQVLETQFEGPAFRQEITRWFKTDEGVNPNVHLIWFGDLDGDRKPDAIIQDMPQEMGVRISLFLSSKARPGALLHKVCEYWLPLE